MQISSFQILLCFIILTIAAILLLQSLRVPPEYSIYVQAAAQRATTTIASPDLAKVFIDNSIQQLQSGNISKTITHLRSAEQELISSGTGNHYFPFQSLSTLLIVKDVIQSLENGDTNKAAANLNLADQQLGRALLNILLLLPNATNKTAATVVAHISNGTFLTYTNFIRMKII